MDLFESIFRRKSCRSYTKEPADKQLLEEISKAIEGFEPLYPDVKLSHRFVSQTKGLYNIQAPNYLVVSGTGDEREKESTGFLFEQLVLWFDAHDIGCVWLGEAKDALDSGKNDIITIAFGMSDESVHREEAAFKRNDIEEITNAPQDDCIRAAHLAPSGMNTQPWYFEKQDDKILVFKKKLKPPVSLVYKKTDIDMGIALCHYAVACRHFNKPFDFQRKKMESAKKGYEFFGEIS